MRTLTGWWLCVMLLFSASSLAADYSHPQVERLLAADRPPEGVVFELLAWDQRTWSWAAPMIADLRAQLRRKYPAVPVAIVSHGGEQFQLTRSRALQQPGAVDQLTGLVEEGVELHVCGAHSLWQQVPLSDYLEIVDVVPSGPARVNDYVELGYTLILLQHPPE
jgi:intracellular sulfur oxidation DsrE/DsrF family protein